MEKIKMSLGVSDITLGDKWLILYLRTSPLHRSSFSVTNTHIPFVVSGQIEI